MCVRAVRVLPFLEPQRPARGHLRGDAGLPVDAWPGDVEVVERRPVGDDEQVEAGSSDVTRFPARLRSIFVPGPTEPDSLTGFAVGGGGGVLTVNAPRMEAEWTSHWYV